MVQVTDEHVKQLLRAALRLPDPRAPAAVSLLLSQSLTTAQLSRVSWRDFDLQNRMLRIRFSRTRIEDIPLSNWMVTQFRRIPVGCEVRIFAPTQPTQPHLKDLLARILLTAKLNHLCVESFVAWSKTQTPRVRSLTAS